MPARSKSLSKKSSQEAFREITLTPHLLFYVRQLSNGHFSDDNQKRLNGRNIDVPIYEAKMTRDLRLVVS